MMPSKSLINFQETEPRAPGVRGHAALTLGGADASSHFGRSGPKFVFRNYTPHADELKEFVVLLRPGTTKPASKPRA